MQEWGSSEPIPISPSSHLLLPQPTSRHDLSLPLKDELLAPSFPTLTYHLTNPPSLLRASMRHLAIGSSKGCCMAVPLASSALSASAKSSPDFTEERKAR